MHSIAARLAGLSNPTTTRQQIRLPSVGSLLLLLRSIMFFKKFLDCPKADAFLIYS